MRSGCSGPLCRILKREADSENQNSHFGWLYGEAVRVFSAEYLMAVCVQVGRAKDKIRLDQFLREKCSDGKKFEDILSRHNLTEKYERIKKLLED